MIVNNIYGTAHKVPMLIADATTDAEAWEAYRDIAKEVFENEPTLNELLMLYDIRKTGVECCGLSVCKLLDIESDLLLELY